MLPSYLGIIIIQYEDPYQPASIMASRRVFLVAHFFFSHDIMRRLGGQLKICAKLTALHSLKLAANVLKNGCLGHDPFFLGQKVYFQGDKIPPGVQLDSALISAETLHSKGLDRLPNRIRRPWCCTHAQDVLSVHHRCECWLLIKPAQ